METISSETKKAICVDLGKFRHVVNYTADDTNPEDVRIKTLTDDIINLIAPNVASTPKGKLEFDGHNIKATSFIICPCLTELVTGLRNIIKAIEEGTQVENISFPTPEPTETKEGAKAEETLKDRED